VPDDYACHFGPLEECFAVALDQRPRRAVIPAQAIGLSKSAPSERSTLRRSFKRERINRAFSPVPVSVGKLHSIASSYEDFDPNGLDETYTTTVVKVKPPTNFLQDRYTLGVAFTF
jgi:hypothetical protein